MGNRPKSYAAKAERIIRNARVKVRRGDPATARRGPDDRDRTLPGKDRIRARKAARR